MSVGLAHDHPCCLDRDGLAQAARALGVSVPTMRALNLAWAPARFAQAGPTTRPDIQSAIDDYIGPAVELGIDDERGRGGCLVRLGPVYTLFVTMRLARRPTMQDRERLHSALVTIESVYPFATSGVFTCISYGIPYFDRLDGGFHGELVARFMPRLRSTPARYCLDETFQTRDRHETNDILLTMCGDSAARIADVLGWLTGDGTRLGGRSVGGAGLEQLLRVTTRRLAFRRRGLPRELARINNLPFADSLSERSHDWLGVSRTRNGPSPQESSFAGSTTVNTTARKGDYFDNGSVLHLAHVVLDVAHWIGLGSSGSESPLKTHHLDRGGAGLDSLDMPDGAQHPKWHLSVFAPAARVHNMLEGVGTTTRAQNFLTPPRRHRAFPLLEYSSMAPHSS